ncbi:MAG: phenylalanine--tRNA ligase subunit beta [Deltaproteobacteria bacterium]|nr:phenylalanine--tRNA ligase subunit beta [Deltaproteobacteria bacterium]
MPVVNIDVGWLGELLGRSYAPAELGEALEQMGCDVEDVVDIARYRCPACAAVLEASLGAETVKSCEQCGHADEEPFPVLDEITVIRLDLLAARPDLFDIGGLARALRGYLGLCEGLPDFSATASDVVVEVSPDLSRAESYRPFIRCAVVHMPALGDRLLSALMKLQESLHWGVGRDRKLASIGVYDLSTVKLPIAYRTLDPDAEPFEPLGMPGRLMTGRQILEGHPKGTAYAHLLADAARYPVLVDAAGQVLSMPPIINSEGTKVRPGSERLFVDVTGISEAAVAGALLTLVCSLGELGGRIETVAQRGPSGTWISPDLSPREAEIELERARRWLGLPLAAESLMQCLRRMRLDVEPRDAARSRFRVRYPAFRSDIRHMVDVFEDVAIGYGYRRIEPALVPTMTVGGARPEEALSERVRAVMTGLGYSEVMSLPMTTEQDHFLRLRLPVPEHYPRVANPKLKALTVLRTHLMDGVMAALREGRRRPMPLRLFELDNAVVLDGAAAHGTREERRLCFAEAGREAGYARARAVLDALLRELGLAATYTAAEHSSFTPGRCARVEAGSVTGVLGELHPEVIVDFGLDHPVALAEIALAVV